MTQYTGHSNNLNNTNMQSYETFKAAVNGNGYDWDSTYGDQCWDGCQIVWAFYGMVLSTNGTGYVKHCWDEAVRASNAGSQFELIYDKTQIKKGDALFLSSAGSYGSVTGHCAWADEDYNGTDTMAMLGQNQGGTPYSGGGAAFNIANLSLVNFLGAFRNKSWATTPPPTPVTIKKSNFPWVLYARRLRNSHTM